MAVLDVGELGRDCQEQNSNRSGLEGIVDVPAWQTLFAGKHSLRISSIQVVVVLL